MRRFACALFAAVAFFGAASPAHAACRERDAHVVLYGGGDDPGVFLWDSRFRLRAYHLATFDEAEAMLPRARLVRGGTRAFVLVCLPNFVQAPYGLGVADAVDVRIISGPLRGVTGWVSGADMRHIH